MAFINSEMMLPKLMYLMLFCIVGSSLPFFVGMMKHAGLTTFQAGLISGMRNIFFVISLLWGVLADYIGKRRIIYCVNLIATVALLTPMPFVSHYICNINKKNTTLNFSITSNLTTNENKVSEDCRKTQYDIFMIFIFSSACFYQATLAFTDASVVNYIAGSKSPNSFGVQRSFGSLGFGISSLVVGVAIDNNKTKWLPKYAPASFIIFFAGLFLLPTSMMLYRKCKWGIKSSKSNFSIIDVLKKLADADKILFLFSVLVLGTGYGIVNALQFIFMKESINASDSLAGLSLSLSFVSEVIMFPFTKYFLKYLNGPTNCIALGAFSYFLRYILMSYSYNPFLVIALQIFHAFGFALYWAAAIAKVNSFATKECLTTILSLVSFTQFGMGNLVANVFGGWLYDKIGGRLMYRYTSFAFLFLSVILVVFERFYQKKKRYTINENANEMKPTN